MDLSSPIIKLKGIGDKTAKIFEKLNIFTVEDVLFHFPRNYFRYPEAITIEEITSLQESMIFVLSDIIEERLIVFFVDQTADHKCCNCIKCCKSVMEKPRHRRFNHNCSEIRDININWIQQK